MSLCSRLRLSTEWGVYPASFPTKSPHMWVPLLRSMAAMPREPQSLSSTGGPSLPCEFVHGLHPSTGVKCVGGSESRVLRTELVGERARPRSAQWPGRHLSARPQQSVSTQSPATRARRIQVLGTGRVSTRTLSSGGGRGGEDRTGRVGPRRHPLDRARGQAGADAGVRGCLNQPGQDSGSLTW